MVPRAASLVATLAMLAASVAHADDGDRHRRVHYEILGRYTLVRQPVALVNLYPSNGDSDTFAVWYPARAFGVQIIEHGGGPITLVNALFLAVGGARYYQNTRTGEITNDASLGPIGKEASWTFDYSSTYYAFRADSWWNRWLGWRFGLWSMRQLSTDDSPHAMLPQATTDLLAAHQASYVQNSGGFEVELLLRYPLPVPLPGRTMLELDAPVAYLLAEWAVGAGVLDKDSRFTIYADGGVPRLGLHWQEAVGPLSVHVTGTVPTTFLVAPTIFAGAQLSLAAGGQF